MELSDAGFGRDQEAPPDQGTNIPKHYSKLVKFCHSSSLPDIARERDKHTPRILPLSMELSSHAVYGGGLARDGTRLTVSITVSQRTGPGQGRRK
jgi:hypothetical protein